MCSWNQDSVPADRHVPLKLGRVLMFLELEISAATARDVDSDARCSRVSPSPSDGR